MKISTIGILTYFSCQFVIGQPGYGQNIKETAHILIADLSYAPGDSVKADIYLPVNYKTQVSPILIFFGEGDTRKFSHYTNWAKLAASKGFAGIVYSSTENKGKEHFTALLNFLVANRNSFQIDPQQLAIYAGSGNATEGLALANNNIRIKAAIIFYGSSPIDHFRIDLPVLLIRSGLDNTGLNRKLDTLAFRALQANAPYTIVNINYAEHAFEDIQDPQILSIMTRSLDFLQLSLQPASQKNYAEMKSEIEAMRELYNGNLDSALNSFKQALKNHPGNNETERQIGNIYIEMKNWSLAIEAYNAAIEHGNWRKGEIAKKKCLAFAATNQFDSAISEMRVLKSIGFGWFNQDDYTNNSLFQALTESASYKKFLKEIN